ncbi:zinc finger, CCHC-type containing protein [Tanacetum coccineum]
MKLRFMIKRFRTNRRGEYMDTLYFQFVGIIYETTALYTPQQNGISERKNKVLKEMVNSMLSYSELSQVEVVRLSDLKLKTLGERGLECIFVIYAEHSKAFRFYIIEPNDSVSIISIIESRDAIFDENRFSSVPRPSLRIPNGTEDIGGLVVPEEVTKEEQEMRSLTNTPIALMLRMNPKHLMKQRSPMMLHSGKNTPMDTSEKLMPNKGQDVSQLEYSMVIGCLMYAMTCTWPDIDFTMGNLSRIYDASWLRYPMTFILLLYTSWWVFCLGGGAISWLTLIQENKLASNITGFKNQTMERNFLALANCCAATLAKAYSQMYNGKSRHLSIKHSMIHDLITNEVISIEFVRSQQNLADHLTKGLARDLVIKSAEGMGLKSN